MKKASKSAASSNGGSREFFEGAMALDSGVSSSLNPYPVGSMQHKEWLRGCLSVWDRGIAEQISVSEAAAALGRQNRGKTKTISQAERLRRRARLAYARKFRWGPPPCA